MRKQPRRIPNALGSRLVGRLLIVVLVVLGGCGGDDDEQGADARSTDQAQLAGTPLFGGSLQPGQRYRTRSFQPALSFVVHDGDWLARETKSPTLVVLDGSRLPNRPMFLAFQRYRRVYGPDRPGHGQASTVPAPQVRFIAIESDREPVVITVEALPRDFARFTARVLRVLNSVRLAQAP
jgi:hypothetical protein